MIGVLYGFTATQQTNESLPDDAVAPILWAAVSIWLRQKDDGDRTFEQRINITRPDGVALLDTTVMQFKMTHRTHQLVLNAMGFPVGLDGEYRITLSLREAGTGDWNVVSEYPMLVTNNQREAANEQA